VFGLYKNSVQDHIRIYVTGAKNYRINMSKTANPFTTHNISHLFRNVPNRAFPHPDSYNLNKKFFVRFIY